MASATKCDHCGYDVPPSWVRCPHCALPGLFPNVRAAEDETETKALDERYANAMRHATARGTEDRVREFESALAKCQAVIARSVTELERLASSDKELYTTYYKLKDTDSRIPEGDKWDVLRPAADSPLFPDYKEDIRFAALSLDGSGVKNYGPCSLVLKENMIAHRASVFEENSVLFMEHHEIRVADTYKLPVGYRAPWQDRARLCVAKLGDRIDTSTRPHKFAELLMKQGATTEDDEFVEVHVWGPVSVRTCERIIVVRKNRRPAKGKLAVLRNKLRKFDLALEER